MKRIYGFFLLMLCTAACQPSAYVIPATPSVTRPPTIQVATTTVSAMLTNTLTAVPAQPSPTPTPTFQVCSPLVGYFLEELPTQVSNPFNPPAPGSDFPHHGIDLVDLQPGKPAPIVGSSINSVLAGVVAAVLPERFPYGNAVLVESQLEELPEEWLAGLVIPQPWEGAPPNTTLTCPEGYATITWDTGGKRSLYLLYAHLEQVAEMQIGNRVACGQALGTMGMTGNAYNPHLHLEVRIGPSGARFDSMDHYDTSASPQEMAAYCLWRVSGQFLVVDPLNILAVEP